MAADTVEYDVIVCGLGPVGAAACHGLAGSGKKVLAFEQTALDPYWAPRAVAFDRESIRCSRSILGEGLHEWIKWNVYPLGEILHRDGFTPMSRSRHKFLSYDVVKRVDGSNLPQKYLEAMYGEGCYAMNTFHQPSFEKELRRTLPLRGVQVKYRHQVTKVENLSDGCEPYVKVYVAVLDAEVDKVLERRAYTAKYCFGCEGGSSLIRDVDLKAGYAGNTYPDEPWLVVDCEVNDLSYLSKCWIGSGATLSAFALEPSRPYVYIRTPAFAQKWFEEANRVASEQIAGWSTDKEDAIAYGSYEANQSFEENPAREKWRRLRANVIQDRVKKFTTERKQGDPMLPLNTGMRFELLLTKSEAELSNREKLLSHQSLKKILKESCGVDIDRVRVVRKIVYTFHARKATYWKTGNVFLLGDSAHCVPPFKGQGLNLGMRDVFNLVWKLALVLEKKASPQILDTYETERRRNVETTTNETLKLGSIVQERCPRRALIRDVKIRWASSKTSQLVSPPKVGILPSDDQFPSLLSPLCRHKVVGIPVPSPIVFSPTAKRRLPLENMYSHRGFSLIFLDSNGKQNPFVSLSPESKDYLASIHCSLLSLGLSNLKSVSTDTFHDVVDIDGFFTTWLAKHDIQDHILVVRPDLYIYGVFKSSAIENIIVPEFQLLLSGRCKRVPNDPEKSTPRPRL